MIYRSFSKRQQLTMTWWNRPGLKEYDAIICDGAVRAGKTVALTDGFFLWSMACFSGETFALCGRTVSALQRNIVRNLPNWLGGLMDIRESRSEGKLTVRWGCRRNTYYLFGGQDESSCKVVQGITLAGALLDEAALMPRSFVEQVCARCSVVGSKLWFSCNPEGPEHWFYKEWICRSREKNALHLHFTMDDNPGLSPKIRQRYARLYSGVFYERYILGKWCMAEGLVYAFDRDRHIAASLPEKGRYYISVDYGTMNPFSAGLWCVTENRAVRLREYYYSGRETGRLRTDEEYYEALVALAGEYPVERIVIDPSAASLIAVIRRHGRFSVRKARNDVLPGIRLVTALLRRGLFSLRRNASTVSGNSAFTAGRRTGSTPGRRMTTPWMISGISARRYCAGNFNWEVWKMKKWKKWLQEDFLPMWAKETVLHDNRRLAAQNLQLRQRLQVLEGYVKGLEAGLRSSRRAKRGEGGKA